MGHEEKSNFKFAENVKIKLSKNGKYINHVLPNEKVIVSTSVKYYQKMLAGLAESAVSNDPPAITDVNKD